MFFVCFYHRAQCVPKHVCVVVQVWVFQGGRQSLLLVLTLGLIREGLCCFAASCVCYFACWWAFGDAPLSASHLPLGVLELQMCYHSWLYVGSWVQTLVFMLSWRVLLAPESSPPHFVGELFCFLMPLLCFLYTGSGVLYNFILSHLFCVSLKRFSQDFPGFISLHESDLEVIKSLCR